MRRLGIVIAFATGLSLGFAMGTDYAAHAAGYGPCTATRYEVDRSMGTAKQHAHVRGLIRCAVRRWPVEGGPSFAIGVADCESSLYWKAHNGTYKGLYQIGDWWGHPGGKSKPQMWLKAKWFPRWLHKDRQPGPYNERANVLVAIRWANHLTWDAWACA